MGGVVTAPAPAIRFDRAYYDLIMREFGYDPLQFGRISFKLGLLDEQELQLRWLCHHEGEAFARALSAPGEAIVSTGFGISGVPHAGTLSQILRSIVLQESGLAVNMVLGDLDAHNGKAIPLSRTRDLAERYRAFILALGFRAEPPSCLRAQFEATDVLRTAYLIGHHIDDRMFEHCEEDLHELYRARGKVDADMSYRRKLSLNLMTADFIHLHLAGGYRDVLIMLGVDEHRYVRFGREVARRMLASPDFAGGGLRLSALYSPLIRGFNGYPKMSKSFPDSGISVDMGAGSIRDLIVDGEGDYDKPENNVVYQMMASTMLDTAAVGRYYDACVEGGRPWVQSKLEYADYMIELCRKWV